MNRILELKQQRAALIAQAGLILTKAADEKRAMTPEEDAQYNAIHVDAESRRTTCEAEERQAAANASLADTREQRAAGGGGSVDQLRERASAAIRSYLCSGQVAAEHGDLMFPASQSAMNFRAAQTIGTGSSGGYTVPQGFWAAVQAAMKFYGGMRQANTFKLSTDMGNPLPIPTSDDTSNTGELIAENVQVAPQDIAFGSVTLNAYKFSSKLILIPFELLQDSGVDIEAFVSSRIGERLGRVQNTFQTTGTGTSQPQGIVTAATLGKTGASGQTTTLIYNDLVDLKYAVNRAYRDGAQWMMNDATLAAILKLVDGSSRPLFESAYNVSLKTGEPDTLLGQGVIINNDMAVMAASAKSILYGAFSSYWIRDVKAMMLLRLVERYADYGQVGFITFTRSDAKLVDAGQHPVKYYINAAS
jgi:HK97 family phage major capsid protein